MSDESRDNTTALMTGASSGIGKEIAKRLLAEGFTVYVAACRVEKMRDLEELGASALEMEITKVEDIIRVVDLTAAECGGVDVLINNADFGL
jgi:NAD(P)-dependent dehydrogenase (short-subunit alcohol dehydrogenase family)